MGLYTAVTDTKNVASIEVRSGSQSILFGYSRLNDLKPAAGKNDIDRVDVNQLNKVDSSGQLAGEVIGHEIMEAYVGVAEGLSDFSKAHARADEYFGQFERQGLQTLPAGAATADSAVGVYSFGRLGVKVNVEKIFTTPQPAASVGSNWTRITGNLKVSAINPTPKPAIVNPKETKP